MPGNPRAFTLIELLIVVAIIAILAAIAVPNFLEAQVRSKVSRCLTDMRSLATGIEAYTVDHTGPPYAFTYFGVPGYPHVSCYEGLIRLTTPVSYMTSIPKDPFQPDAEDHYITAMTNGTYWYAIEESERIGWSYYDSPVTAWDGTPNIDDWWWEAGPSNPPWMLAGFGPDRRMMFDVYDEAVPWVEPITQPAMWATAYDPSNGTVSVGDILRYP